MPNYPYDDLGTLLDTTNLERLNNNYDQIQADIADVSSYTTQKLNFIESDYTQKLNLQKSEYTSRLDAQYANYTAKFGEQRAEYTAGFQTQKTRIDKIVDEINTDVIDGIVDSAKISWLSPVPNFAALNTTYSAANTGETAQTLDDSKIYRFNGSDWVFVQKFGIGPVTAIQQGLQELQDKTVGFGTKTQRPTSPETADLFFLTDKKRRIEYNGSSWQYLDGTPVDILEITDSNIYATSLALTTQTLTGNAETVYQNGIDMTKDFIFYTKMKLNDSDDFFNMLFNVSSTNHFYLSFGYNWNTNTKDGSTISVRDYINSTNTVLGTVNLYSTAHDVIVWYDHNWGYLNVYIDNVLIGSWKPAVGGSNLAGITRVYGKAGSTTTLVTLDYYYMASPLVVAIGDSITAGAILHAPNPDHYPGVDNYANNYPKMVSDNLRTSGIRNYFVVNKGVNGETTDQMKARFATDVVAKGCKYVLIHGGINDHATHGNVATTSQNKIDMANVATSNTIEPLLLGVIPTKTTAPLLSHQFSIALHAQELSAYQGMAYVDLWKSIEGTTNIADNSKMADTVHPNILGYTAMATELNKAIKKA